MRHDVMIRLQTSASLDTLHGQNFPDPRGGSTVAHHYGTPAWAASSQAPPLSLVDRLFLLTHDTANGKPLIALDVLGIGLAGAALLELAQGGWVSVKHSGEVVRVSEHAHPDEASHYVLMQIYEREPQGTT